MSLRAALARAVERQAPPSSDYDLNRDADAPDRVLRQAGVLIAVVDAETPRLILTKRSSALKHHPGQISFPGGKVEEYDSDVVAAALREAEEEIALREVEVLGCLAPHVTVTGFNVVPVLGLVQEGYSFRPDEEEVAEVFEVPLPHVLNPANYLVESRLWRGKPRYYFTVPWGPYYIWGATARMLRALADRMADGPD
ncbi:MAG: CoA pyrophosphatase [Silicimonas sp.]|nr:CoA pyrophosphatase [Silicimonas sp.]